MTIPLLPSGLQDMLPPLALRDRYVTGRLLDRFALFGYEQVNPPLMEFEDTLFAGKGKAHEHNTFRVMDTVSQRMMGVRPDITPQIERIATSMLAGGKGITRLAYAGQVLRVAPSGLTHERQLRQAGIEQIGRRELVSETEVLTATMEALQTLGLKQLVLSLSVAGLFDILFSGCLKESQELIRKSVYHKDIGGIPDTIPHRELTIALLTKPVSQILETHELPAAVEHYLKQLLRLRDTLELRFPGILTIHLDPLDTEGFSYHDGICFAVLDSGTQQEIGRGGSYCLNDEISGCGVSLYVDRLIRSAIDMPAAAEKRDITDMLSYEEAKAMRDAGLMTILTE